MQAVNPSIDMPVYVPYLPPVPKQVDGVSQVSISLNGEWLLETEDESKPFTVPGDVHAGHIKRGYRGEYTLSRSFSVPKDFLGQRVLMRFSATNGYARVFVNDKPAGEHLNSYLAWSTDITERLIPGNNNVKIIFNEALDRLAHYGGGLPGDVCLYCVPNAYLRALDVQTDFDESYTDAVLSVFADLSAAGTLTLLLDRSELVTRELEAGKNRLDIKVAAPRKWDAEHPNLYTLTALFCGSTVSREIGFRKLERRQNHVYVNGREIKLRGACRHETGPLTGCYVPRELVEKDIRAIKYANINYIRTSHNPPSEYFLDLCDKYGIYVEDEEGIAFVARSLDYTQRDPSHTNRYLSNFIELFARDRSHPSVIIWSIANESFGGMNFDAINRYIHRTDRTRLTKFSYPMTMRETDEEVDIWSIHYQMWNNDLSFNADNCGVAGIADSHLPVLHDEFAHLACYNKDEQRRDPFVRAAWGRYLCKYYDNIWNTPGCLGGALWAMIDEHRVEWGFVDIFRRYKPEIYGVRRAFTPVKALSSLKHLNGEYFILLENRFNHTDFGECRAVLGAGGVQYPVSLPCTAPGERLELKITAPYSDDAILSVYGPDGECVIEYKIPVSAPEAVRNIVPATGLNLGKYSINQSTGLINPIGALLRGPFLHLSDIDTGVWQAEKVCEAGGSIISEGHYSCGIRVRFTYTLTDDVLNVSCKILDMGGVRNPYRKKIRVGLDKGGFGETGICFLVSSALDRLEWRRFGDCDVYDLQDIARDAGQTTRQDGAPLTLYMQAPECEWKDDLMDYILYGRYPTGLLGSRDWRCLKPELDTFTLSGSGKITGYNGGIRIEQLPYPLVPAKKLDYAGEWFAAENKHAFGGEEAMTKEAGAKASLSFTGMGCVWYASRNVINGRAAVYIDGKLIDGDVDTKVSGQEFSTSSPGDDRKFRLPIFAINRLENAAHTLTIEAVSGVVTVDAIAVIGSVKPAQKLIYVNNWAFPHLSWGNYTPEPVLVYNGSTFTAALSVSEEE